VRSEGRSLHRRSKRRNPAGLKGTPHARQELLHVIAEPCAVVVNPAGERGSGPVEIR